MFKNLCLLLVFVLSLGNVLRLHGLGDYEFAFWGSLMLCTSSFFLTFYHSIKAYVELSKEKKPRLSDLKKDTE